MSEWMNSTQSENFKPKNSGVSIYKIPFYQYLVRFATFVRPDRLIILIFLP